MEPPSRRARFLPTDSGSRGTNNSSVLTRITEGYTQLKGTTCTINKTAVKAKRAFTTQQHPVKHMYKTLSLHSVAQK